MKKLRNIIVIIFVMLVVGLLWSKNSNDSKTINSDTNNTHYTNEEDSNESIEQIKQIIKQEVVMPIKLKDMEKVSIDNINIYYTNEENSKESIELIKKFIPEVEKNIANILPNIREKNLDIILYDNKENLVKDAYELDNVSGFYSHGTNSIHIIKYNTDTFDAEWRYEQLFMHEYAHFKFNTFLEQNDIDSSSIPIWFNEGFSVYIGFNNAKVGVILHEEEDFTTLSSTKDFEQARKENYKVYLQCYYAIDELIKTEKDETIKNIILETKETDFYTAFESVTKMSINEFQKIYLDDEKEENPWGEWVSK